MGTDRLVGALASRAAVPAAAISKECAAYGHTFPDGHARVQQYDNEGRVTSRCYSYTDPSKTRGYAADYDPVVLRHQPADRRPRDDTEECRYIETGELPERVERWLDSYDSRHTS